MATSQSFGESVDPAAAISAILGSYPFSVGLFRELIQNSEDAGATRQIFVLDCRQHQTESLFDPKFAPIQAPALSAYNDAMFVEDDWIALQNIHKSSKKTDTSKIGKYGVGVRSCYHVSDNLQVLSGPSMVLLDPLHTVSRGGARFNLIVDHSRYRDQLTPFDFFFDSLDGNMFRGTVIRLPLRTAQSRISSKIVSTSEISQLFRDFVEHEIDIALLFLRNIKSIEIHQIDEKGNRKSLAKSTITRDDDIVFREYTKHTSHVRTTTENGTIREKSWYTLSRSFSQVSAISLLSERLGGDATRRLVENKLNPNISISIPTTILSRAETCGRLFTFLPLPLDTGFPAHVHALFALTQSRQNLRNEDTGMVKGSDDRVFAEWNRILFDYYIPRTWTALLEVLAREDMVGDIFQAWPQSQPINYTGDAINWQWLPAKLVEDIVSSKSAIWPVVSPQRKPTRYVDIHAEAVVVVKENASDELIAALSLAGLRIVRPPLYVVNHMLSSSCKCAILTPKIAHQALSVLTPMLEKLSDTQPMALTVILEYLLSTCDMASIIGLPLIPLVDGRRIALHLRSEQSSIVYTMFEHSDFNVFGCDDIFGCCDDDTIPMHMLSHSAAETLRVAAKSGSFNLEQLQWQTIVRYLELYPNRLGLDLSQVRIDVLTVEWLSKFWDWMGSWRDQEILRQHISHLYLLPSQTGLKKADIPLFESVGVHPVLLHQLRNLGVSFLHPKFAQRSQSILKFHGFLHHVDNIECLLQVISTNAENPLDGEAVQVVIKHVVQHAPAFLSDSARKLLRSLPLFPILSPGTNDKYIKVSKSWRSIPEGTKTIGVYHAEPLPLVKNTIFLDLNSITPSILSYLQPSESKQEMDIIQLALDHFTEQPQHIQACFVNHIMRNRHRIPPNMIELVGNIPFVFVTGGSMMQTPSKLIDPSSSLASLFPKDSYCLPRMEYHVEKEVVNNLQVLRLFQDVLTPKLVYERIQFVAKSQSVVTATRLLSMITCSAMKREHLAQSISSTNEVRWLPTNRGLLNPRECRDNTSCPELFNEVLGLLDDGTPLSSDLRHALGWHDALPLAILIQQLGRTLERGHATKERQHIIIKELAMRDLSDLDMKELLQVVENRTWIPIHDQSQDRSLVGTADVVFDSTPEGTGFYELSFKLKASRSWLRIQTFLERMGCSKRPSANAVISKLEDLRARKPTDTTTKTALDLLGLFSPSNLKESQIRERILIPDREGCLRPLTKVYYNDISDPRACLPEEGDYFLANAFIDEDLSKRLCMERLGLRLLPLQNPDVDMGEKPITTVRNALRQYTEEQLLLEFLANAADAGATEFSVLIDQQPAPAEHLVSRAFVKFQQCPAVLIHNNATFSDKDFEGICKTGIGGKAGQRDTIGQFGLGALTMFHLTEFAMVVSGKSVLFLNPSRELLPILDRASLLFPLEHMKRFYPDHVRCLDGVFGFQFAASTYNGTIFRLPLRQLSHSTGIESLIFPRIWGIEDVDSRILKPFEESAPKCLLFTKVNHIQVGYRANVGGSKIHLSVRAERNALSPISDIAPGPEGDQYTSTITSIQTHRKEGPYYKSTISSTERWMTVTTVVRETFRSPAELLSLSEKYRLRSPSTIGLAARIHSDRNFTGCKHNLFSTLPLAVSTTLPVHLTAPFILSSDRRQIRMDSYDNMEAEYNMWLLTSILPSVYVFLLEKLLAIGDNKDWWPGDYANPEDIDNSQEDPISLSVINAFYDKYVKDTDRNIFCSAYHPSVALSPKDVILVAGHFQHRASGKITSSVQFRSWSNPSAALSPRGVALSEPPAVRKTLSLLKSPLVAAFPPRIYKRLIHQSRLTPVQRPFVRDEIARDPPMITSSLSIPEIEEVSRWLIEPNEPRNIVGLPLLPLQAEKQYGELEMGDSSAKTYYILDSSSQNLLLFRPDHLVHPNFDAKHLITSGLNVANVSPDAVKNLVGECLSPAREEKNVSKATQEWISAFWAEYPISLKTPPDFISSFPLVAAMQSDCFVSLDFCKSESVILANSDEEIWIWDCFNQLGITVVDARNKSGMPGSLHDILVGPGFSRFNCRSALAALQQSSAAIIPFTALGLEFHAKLAKWIRSEIYQDCAHFSIARTLPIWPARCRTELTLEPASNVLMLPQGVDLDTAALFLHDMISEYSYPLTLLDVQPLQVSEFYGKLDIPPILSNRDQLAYKKLLAFILAHSPNGGILPLFIPNHNGVKTALQALYAQDDLFIAAFGPQSPLFISALLLELEFDLRRHGLQQQCNLNIEMFRACAQAIHDDREADKTVRAATIFRVYSEDLPLRISSDSQNSWKLVDNLRFIPRYIGTSYRPSNNGTLDVTRYAPVLPYVVAPREVVREECEGISWTQRARFQTEPHQRVLIANPSFGVPEAFEVVKHLTVLALQVAIAHPSNPHVLRDLKATYQWLSAHAEDAATSIIQHHSEPLFLNVNDPESEPWLWNSADELFFEEYDHGETACYVRDFLLPFKELLLVAGAQDVVHSKSSEPAMMLSSETQLQMIREKYEDMRKRRILTDVVFISVDDDKNADPLEAHRSYLSVFSEHFRIAFWGGVDGFKESAPRNVARMSVNHARKCVEAVLDYAYTGKKCETEDTEELLEVMELSSYWNVSGLFEVVQRRIGDKSIHPSTLDEIRNRAEKHQARTLLSLCDEYEKNNAGYIRRMREAS